MSLNFNHSSNRVLQEGALGLIGKQVSFNKSDGSESRGRIQGLRYPLSPAEAPIEAVLIQSGKDVHELLSPALADQSKENA